MTQPTMTGNSELVAELNDLLQLDHDAVNAYGIAIQSIDNASWKESLIRYRGDHERHIDNLTTHIRVLGGIPMQLPHVPTGIFKSAVQLAGKAGGDRAILLAFKSNEGQVRDKYSRAANAGHPQATTALLRQNARDEETHYAWVSGVLESIGAGADTTVGKAEAAFEKVHGGAATAMEDAEKVAMNGAQRLRRRFRSTSPKVKAAIGVGLALLVVRRLVK
ncbi:MAG TPA: ferritin-like domain-containing protein [Gemmatimonadaceae bacterium]|jgi:bacterioferritin (cytochrome b1)|nr:ferritin-like domain-containing protein [Gemmatimonadaceae bacterium]